MFYLRERRLWLLVKPSGEVKFAFSANRRTLEALVTYGVEQRLLAAQLPVEQLFLSVE